MRKGTGSRETPALSRINPVRDTWRQRWNYEEAGDGGATWMEEDYDHEPTDEERRATMEAWARERAQEEILRGFSWQGTAIWLSQENQNNYRAALVVATQTQGANLPYCIKGGTDAAPEYVEFETTGELLAFAEAMEGHIRGVLERLWAWRERNFN